ncbi:MAG: recombinase family protein [Patescibacteria group bacterium]
MEYIIYCRKSSEAEDRQVLSIDSQFNELQNLAKRENLKIKKVFKESMSAKAPGRPVFNEMMNYIKENENKEIGLLVWKLDRLSRNPVDGGNLIWLLDTKDILEIKTFEKTYKNIADDKFFMSIDFGISKKFVDDLSVNVKRGNRAKLETGGWPNHAPLGYKNDKTNNTIVIDKKLSVYIVRSFELCATGNYSIKEISDALYQDGMRTKSGKKVFKGTFQRMLNKTFYYGVMERDGKFYKGTHKPLISKELFDKAKYALEERNRPKRQSLFFPYRGFINCSCGCAYTASIKRGHDYYYCTNGKSICEAHKNYMRSENIDELMAAELEKIKFNKENIEISYEACKEKHLNNADYRENAKANIEKELLDVQRKEAKLLDTYLSDLIEQSLYEAKLRELENNKTALESQIKNSNFVNGNGETTLEQIKNIFLTANRAKENFLERDPSQKRNLLETLLWNVEIENEKIAHSRFKEPYTILANTPKNCDFSTMLGDRDSNPD